MKLQKVLEPILAIDIRIRPFLKKYLNEFRLTINNGTLH